MIVCDKYWGQVLEVGKGRWDLVGDGRQGWGLTTDGWLHCRPHKQVHTNTGDKLCNTGWNSQDQNVGGGGLERGIKVTRSGKAAPRQRRSQCLVEQAGSQLPCFRVLVEPTLPLHTHTHTPGSSAGSTPSYIMRGSSS